MGSALTLRICDCKNANDFLDTNTIHSKVKKLYDTFSEIINVHDGDEDDKA